MGVKNLWKVLEPCKKTLPLDHLQNKRICIDLSCWMVQFINVNKSQWGIRPYLQCLFHRVRALIGLNCSLIFVTDGSIPGIKVSTYRKRLHLDNEIIEEGSSTDENTSLERNMGSVFSYMIEEAKYLGSALGIPCLDGIEEGEAQCALLNSESLCDGCFSSDSDIFLFGARTVYRDICLGGGGYVVCYEMDDIEKKLGFGRNSLIALAILLGCDYSPGVHGIGPGLACKIVRSFSESAVLQGLASEELLRHKKANGSNKHNRVPGFNNKENIPPHESNNNGYKSKLPENHQLLQVMDAYLNPKCHSPDSEMVKRVLGIHPLQKAMLVQTCQQFFMWPPERTDEYILPKLAERDFRRSTNCVIDIDTEVGSCSSGQKYWSADEPLVNTRPDTKEVNLAGNRGCDIETEVVNLSTPLVMKSNRKNETQIVDLVSPFSVVRCSKNLAVDVIDLSESETEVSSKHVKKTRRRTFYL